MLQCVTFFGTGSRDSYLHLYMCMLRKIKRAGGGWSFCVVMRGMSDHYTLLQCFSLCEEAAEVQEEVAMMDTWKPSGSLPRDLLCCSCSGSDTALQLPNG